MPLIQWNDTYSVNVAEIDKQHKKLVALLNELNDAMLAGKGKDVLGRTVNGLIDYAAVHFQTEEKLFDQLKYPDAAAHRKTHADFVAEIADFKARFMNNKVGLSVELMNFLRNWLNGHIKGDDKKYGPYFNAHGMN